MTSLYTEQLNIYAVDKLSQPNMAVTFGERFREHLKTPSPIFNHQNTSGHITSIDNFKIIGREENNVARTIQEAMFIRVNNPTLNKNIGKYNLPHIWDSVKVQV